jgi:putative spermidine/putrescine transport system ATP-binding protein/spermidine/putrescine transport system ATP-binding protein
MTFNSKIGKPISVEHISKSFGNYNVLNDINFKVEQGEFLTLLGSSGCGKSTLLKIIAGFEKVNSGHIFIDEQEITHAPPYVRGIGIMFQNYALFPHMTVYENIAYPIKVRHCSKKEISEKIGQVLETVKLTGFESRFPNQLSGGQQQRCALARAIVYTAFR